MRITACLKCRKERLLFSFKEHWWNTNVLKGYLAYDNSTLKITADLILFCSDHRMFVTYEPVYVVFSDGVLGCQEASCLEI